MRHPDAYGESGERERVRNDRTIPPVRVYCMILTGSAATADLSELSAINRAFCEFLSIIS